MLEQRKILIVSSAFYPEISPRSHRATELAKEFNRQGHEVVVISKYRQFDYSDFLKEFPITFKMWSRQVLPEVRKPKIRPFIVISRIIGRVLLLFFEYPAIEEMFKVKKMLSNEKGYNLLISFAVPYPVHWGTAWSRSVPHRIAEVWVADCGDPYMGDVLDSFRKPFYFRYFEKNFCKRADFISIPTESAKDGYYTEFHHKIKVIPQGFYMDFDQVTHDEPSNEFPMFCYAGGFLPGARDPRPLMDYLILLDVPFRFIVYTNTPEMLGEYKDQLGEKLQISDFIPRSELMKVLVKMDFLVNFDNNTLLNSPSKLIDYAMAKRPILNITKDFNEENVLAFINGDYGKQMLVPDIQKYNIRNVTQLFLDLLNFNPSDE